MVIQEFRNHATMIISEQRLTGVGLIWVDRQDWWSLKFPKYTTQKHKFAYNARIHTIIARYAKFENNDTVTFAN